MGETAVGYTMRRVHELEEQVENLRSNIDALVKEKSELKAENLRLLSIMPSGEVMNG